MATRKLNLPDHVYMIRPTNYTVEVTINKQRHIIGHFKTLEEASIIAKHLSKITADRLRRIALVDKATIKKIDALKQLNRRLKNGHSN